MDKNVILELQNISKDYYRNDRSIVVKVLSDISISIKSGDSYSIIGPSGSGKSTLLNIMGGIDHPTAGNVILNGSSFSELPDEKLSYIRNKDIGFIFQLHHLLPQCTAIENVLIPTLPFPEKSGEEYYQRAYELLKSVGMENRMNNKPGELSGGELLRTAVVRGLINEPKILLADEPTGSLDNVTAGELGELLTQLNVEKKLTLIVVTHSAELAARINNRYELKNRSLNRLK